MEIERKFLIENIPEDTDLSDSEEIEQAYLCTAPVVRIRRYGSRYYLTEKGSGMFCREESETQITEEDYRAMLPNAKHHVIRKTRSRIPDGDYIIELDRFHDRLAPLVMAEVEFPDQDSALSYTPPAWFGKEVTRDPHFHNSFLCTLDSFPIDF